MAELQGMRKGYCESAIVVAEMNQNPNQNQETLLIPKEIAHIATAQ